MPPERRAEYYEFETRRRIEREEMDVEYLLNCHGKFSLTCSVCGTNNSAFPHKFTGSIRAKDGSCKRGPFGGAIQGERKLRRHSTESEYVQ